MPVVPTVLLVRVVGSAVQQTRYLAAAGKRRLLAGPFMPRGGAVPQGGVPVADLLAWFGGIAARRGAGPFRGRGFPGQRPCRLPGGADRHVFGRLGNGHGDAEDGGRDGADRRGARAAADQHHALWSDPARGEVVD